jgi:formylglycine-generating enzyme required for sulfatase activity
MNVMTDFKPHSPNSGGGIKPADFSPLEAPGKRKKRSLSLGLVIISTLSLVAVFVLLFLFIARAVIFVPNPAQAEVAVGGLSFHIGDNFLLLRGDHTISADAPGYYHFEQLVNVSEQRSQEIDIVLEPLPGRLVLNSELDDIDVLIDDEPVGSAPGVIEEVSRGTHIIEFNKLRYFPSRQELEVQGLGQTETLEVTLDPAWGQMSFTTVPAGIELSIDGVAIGQTPLETEVLETGSTLVLSLRGYKSLEKDVFIKAGTRAEYPPVTMIVADGRLEISSSPRGASVTVGGKFKGNTPVSVPLSPLQSHRIELFLEGYQKSVRNTRVEPEESSSLSVNLAPIIGLIQLNISPADSEVLVDGNIKGQGSQTLSLNAREHDISVRKAGYKTQNFKVTPRPEHEQSLDVSLLTNQDHYWSTRPPQITSPVGSRLKLFRPNSTFSMGAARREPGRRANEAQRNVRLERPFYIGTHEVSNAEFRRFYEEHSSRAFRAQTLDIDNQPVSNVSWQGAAQFCNWLSRQQGLPQYYIEEVGMVTGFNVDAHGYRLPTEAEWAWVAKVEGPENILMFPWGNDLYPPSELVENYADQSALTFLSFTLSNYNDGYAVSAPIGKFSPNSKGIYDLSGNVSEWISDYYEIRPSRGEPELDPLGPVTGTRHVVRGASWVMGSRSELRLSYRDAGADARMDTGFRLARYVDKAGINP